VKEDNSNMNETNNLKMPFAKILIYVKEIISEYNDFSAALRKELKKIT